MQFDTVELAIEALRKGESIIVVDDEDRENEGDLIAVTEWMADDTINFMAKGTWSHMYTFRYFNC